MNTDKSVSAEEAQMIISICGEIEDFSDFDVDHLFTGSSISF